jgi:hypothetical protein
MWCSSRGKCGPRNAPAPITRPILRLSQFSVRGQRRRNRLAISSTRRCSTRRSRGVPTRRQDTDERRRAGPSSKNPSGNCSRGSREYGDPGLSRRRPGTRSARRDRCRRASGPSGRRAQGRRAQGRRARPGSPERRSSTGPSHDRPAIRLLERAARGQVTLEVRRSRVVRKREYSLPEVAKRLSLRWVRLHAFTIAPP